jgi:hypothetical protein
MDNKQLQVSKFEITENKLNELQRKLYTKMDEIAILKDEIRRTEKQLCYVCSLDGHNIVTEREYGMYGEIFRICTKCNFTS